MTKKQEPTPLFKINEHVYHHGRQVYILAIKTYCTSCDEFLSEARYLVKYQDTISRPVWRKESQLSFNKEEP